MKVTIKIRDSFCKEYTYTKTDKHIIRTIHTGCDVKSIFELIQMYIEGLVKRQERIDYSKVERGIEKEAIQDVTFVSCYIDK